MVSLLRTAANTLIRYATVGKTGLTTWGLPGALAFNTATGGAALFVDPVFAFKRIVTDNGISLLRLANDLSTQQSEWARNTERLPIEQALAESAAQGLSEGWAARLGGSRQASVAASFVEVIQAHHPETRALLMAYSAFTMIYCGLFAASHARDNPFLAFVALQSVGGALLQFLYNGADYLRERGVAREI